MKVKIKRITAIIIACVMMASVMSVAVSANSADATLRVGQAGASCSIQARGIWYYVEVNSRTADYRLRYTEGMSMYIDTQFLNITGGSTWGYSRNYFATPKFWQASLFTVGPLTASGYIYIEEG